MVESVAYKSGWLSFIGMESRSPSVLKSLFYTPTLAWSAPSNSMILKYKYIECWTDENIFISFLQGLEYYLPQLVNIYIIDMVLYTLDASWPKEICNDKFTFYGGLWKLIINISIYMEFWAEW